MTSNRRLFLICSALLGEGACFSPPPFVPADSGTSSGGLASSSGAAVDDGSPTSSAPASTSTSTTDAGAPDSSSDTGGDVPNAPPVARDDGPFSTVGAEAVVVDAVDGLLINDDDPEGGLLLVAARISEPTERGGVVDIEPDGGFTYHPPAWLPFGTDRFEYTVEDDEGQTARAHARVVVLAQDAQVGLGDLGVKGMRFTGIDPEDRSGAFASTAGDINGDGFADVLIGAYYGDSGGIDSGEAYVVMGGPALPSSLHLGEASIRLEGVDPGDRASFSVDSGGDINGDGLADIAIGAYTASAAGESYIVFGEHDLPPVIDLEDADVRLDGIDPGDNAGISVQTDGDINGDGLSDIFIGAWLADPNDLTDAGEGYLVYGAPSLPEVIDLTDAPVRFEGGQIDDRSCRYVSIAGDVNGDGLCDIMIMGSVDSYLVYGSPSLPPVIVLPNIASDGLGVVFSGLSGRVDIAGDVNGDGFSDVLIGRPLADPSGLTDAGESYLFFGGPDLPSTINIGLTDVRFPGQYAEDRSGAEGLTMAGDINGDGYEDIVIGATVPDDPLGVGRSYVVLGRPAFPPVIELAAADLRFSGSSGGDHTGFPNNTGGDIDGDGFADLLVGAYGADPGGADRAGESYLVYGDDLSATVEQLGTDGDDVLEAAGGPASDRIVGGRGDDVLYSDGGPDVLIGGAGDDTMVVFDSSFFRADGGLGNDTIALGAPFELDLQGAGGSRARGIERLQLSASGPSSIVLSEQRVVNLSKTSNTLRIDGDADDAVHLTSGAWAEPVPIGSHVLYSSTTTAATVAVDMAITVFVP